MPDNEDIQEYLKEAWKQLRKETDDREDALNYIDDLVDDCVNDIRAGEENTRQILQQMLDSGELP